MKKFFAYSLIFCVVLSLLTETVNADHPAPNSGSITVNGTVDGKDIIKGVKKVVKEGGRVVKKVKKKIKKIFG